jgi:CDP-diacylglycerol---glycerol-3-phosphate 3-phosphatidyltransferase
MKKFSINSLNLPLALTLIRLVIAPLVFPFLFVYLLPFDSCYINSALGTLFFLVSLTDFFDGYIARRYGQVTRLGAMLDPIADKFLMMATLISLLAVSKIYFLWVFIFIAREFFVTALRALALEQGFAVPVVGLGKAKTVVQMFYMLLLIVRPLHVSLYSKVWLAEQVLLVSALILSIGSAYKYSKMFMRNAGFEVLL